MKNILLLLFLFWFSAAVGQEKPEYKSKGYTNITEVGALTYFESRHTTHTYASLRTMNGIYLSKSVQIGIGTGLDIYEHSWIPVYADCRVIFLENRVSPYVYANAGYAFALGKDFTSNGFYTGPKAYHQGFLFDCGLGVRAFLPNNKTSALFSLGYHLQERHPVFNSKSDWDASFNTSYFHIKTGFSF
ncbi:MAG: hypothetical protein AB7G44_00165 [Bacteroidia bacterium]